MRARTSAVVASFIALLGACHKGASTGSSRSHVAIGSDCSVHGDADCRQGWGFQLVCGANQQCVTGCHSDYDCPWAKGCYANQCRWDPLGTLSIAAYQPASAIAYADSHWNVDSATDCPPNDTSHRCKQCAEFASDSLHYGGHLAKGVKTKWAPRLVQVLTKLTTIAAAPYDEYSPSQTSVRACAGDIVVHSNATGAQFCTPQGNKKNCGHVGLVVNSARGVNNILADYHNASHYHWPINKFINGTALDPRAGAYSTLRIYHLSSCGGPTGGTGFWRDDLPGDDEPAPVADEDEGEEIGDFGSEPCDPEVEDCPTSQDPCADPASQDCDSCSSDSDCGDNSVCVSGACEDACQSNDDCDEDFPICVSGACFECGQDSDCTDPDFPNCSNNQCVLLVSSDGSGA